MNKDKLIYDLQIAEKQCKKCGIVKSGVEFNLIHKKYLTANCKSCIIKMAREKRNNLPDEEFFAIAKSFYTQHCFFPCFETRLNILKELGLKPTYKGILHVAFKGLFDEISKIDVPFIECAVCHKYKPVDEFRPLKAGIYGVTHCKECFRKYEVDYFKKNPEKVKNKLAKLKIKYHERLIQEPYPKPE